MRKKIAGSKSGVLAPLATVAIVSLLAAGCAQSSNSAQDNSNGEVSRQAGAADAKYTDYGPGYGNSALPKDIRILKCVEDLQDFPTSDNDYRSKARTWWFRNKREDYPVAQGSYDPGISWRNRVEFELVNAVEDFNWSSSPYMTKSFFGSPEAFLRAFANKGSGSTTNATDATSDLKLFLPDESQKRTDPWPNYPNTSPPTDGLNKVQYDDGYRNSNSPNDSWKGLPGAWPRAFDLRVNSKGLSELNPDRDPKRFDLRKAPDDPRIAKMKNTGLCTGGKDVLETDYEYLLPPARGKGNTVQVPVAGRMVTVSPTDRGAGWIKQECDSKTLTLVACATDKRMVSWGDVLKNRKGPVDQSVKPGFPDLIQLAGLGVTVWDIPMEFTIKNNIENSVMAFDLRQLNTDGVKEKTTVPITKIPKGESPTQKAVDAMKGSTTGEQELINLKIDPADAKMVYLAFGESKTLHFWRLFKQNEAGGDVPAFGEDVELLTNEVSLTGGIVSTGYMDNELVNKMTPEHEPTKDKGQLARTFAAYCNISTEAQMDPDWCGNFHLKFSTVSGTDGITKAFINRINIDDLGNRKISAGKAHADFTRLAAARSSGLVSGLSDKTPGSRAKVEAILTLR